MKFAVDVFHKIPQIVLIRELLMEKFLTSLAEEVGHDIGATEIYYC